MQVTLDKLSQIRSHRCHTRGSLRRHRTCWEPKLRAVECLPIQQELSCHGFIPPVLNKAYVV